MSDAVEKAESIDCIVNPLSKRQEHRENAMTSPTKRVKLNTDAVKDASLLVPSLMRKSSSDEVEDLEKTAKKL